MNQTLPYVSGISFKVGTATSIRELKSIEGVSDETIFNLKSMGLEYFTQNNSSMVEMCVQSILETLELAYLSCEQVDAIVFANSNARWSQGSEDELLTAFHTIGFKTACIIGLSLQGCSASGTALQIASNLIDRGVIDNVLVVVCGQVSNGDDRLAPHAATVFSDGAASCIVSSEDGELEIIANESLVDAELAASIQPEKSEYGKYVENGFKNLSVICKTIYEQAQLSPSDIKILFGTNGSSLYHKWMAAAAELPSEKVYNDDLRKYAHVHSCDNLISLRNFLSNGMQSKGDIYLLLSWSPNSVSASILRCRG